MPDPLPILGTMVEEGAQKLTSKLEESQLGRGVLNLWGNQEYELDLTPGGRAAKAMHLQYIQLHDQALAKETQKLAQVREWHSNDDAVRNALPAKTATIADYHAHAVATQHPIQSVTNSILQSDTDPKTGVSRNLALTQQQMMIKNQSIARLKGIEGSYGTNFENLAPILAGMRRSADPNIVQNAQRIADIVSNQVRDTMQIEEHTGLKQDVSMAKYKVNKAFGAANKVLEDSGERPIPTLDTTPTYEKQTEGERTAHRILDRVMLPFLAIKHVGQTFNLPASSPLPAIGSALLQMNHAQMNATVEASSITATTLWSAMYRDILGETGKVSEWTNSPTVGRILSQITHQPGFTWLRKQQLNLAGTVGFHSTIQWAHELATSGSKIAKARLREMQIDPAEVIKQGGKLTDAQLQKGVYHFTNDRMFFSKGIDNSLYQNRNIWTRSAFMYHSFVGSQTAYMRRELITMAKAGDYKGLAQFAGTMAVLFPNIAPLISGAEKLATTGSVQQAGDEIKNRYSRLYSPKSLPDWLENYATLLSHIGAAGVYFNYINAIKGHRLASAMAGPVIGAVTTDIEDTYGAATGDGPDAKKPLLRDALRQGLPVIGGTLSHMLLPTKTEEGSGSSPRSKFRLRSRGRRR
jgi:hypothetical protein